MSERLLSVGLDVGTTSTQLVVSELMVENRASGFAVPEMEITERKIRYRSPVYFTPLVGETLVDGPGVREIVEKEYARAGITREGIDTGAVIITGETSRKENARSVLDSLSDFAGEFVVATAGPGLESVLAAKGAGAVAYSEQTGKRVLHMDIGGGTSNLALIADGKICATGCLNVGGRLLKLDEKGRLLHISPVAKELCKLNPGQKIEYYQAKELAGQLVQALEMAAGLREPTDLLEKLWTKELTLPPKSLVPKDGESTVISFSGGVADCIEKEHGWLEFGDIGPVLGQAIRESRLCQGYYRLGEETIRATVIGAGCHSAQLSGSTVYYRNVSLPVKNLPVVCFGKEEQCREDLNQRIQGRLDTAEEEQVVLAFPGLEAPGYGQMTALADQITAGTGDRPILVCTQTDMAKALGHALALRVNNRPLLCIDRVRLRDGDYLDVGEAVGSALPVVVKTLVLER